jgi:CubicO group peptidase (beta-lactamase class C family)
MEARRIAGLSIALVRGGDVVWEKGYGTANVESGDPVTPETSFAIMSLTKTFVSTALMQLRDEYFQPQRSGNKRLRPRRSRTLGG